MLLQWPKQLVVYSIEWSAMAMRTIESMTGSPYKLNFEPTANMKLHPFARSCCSWDVAIPSLTDGVSEKSSLSNSHCFGRRMN